MPKYVVQDGDSPFRIAGKLYGDQRQAQALAKYLPRNLRPGQVVDLPNFRPGGRNPYVSPTWMQSRLNQDAAQGLPYTQRPGFQQQAFTPEFDWNEYQQQGGMVNRPAPTFWNQNTASLYNTLANATPGGVPGLDTAGVKAVVQAFVQDKSNTPGSPAYEIARAVPAPAPELLTPRYQRKIAGYDGPLPAWAQEYRLNAPDPKQYNFNPEDSTAAGFDWYNIDEARRKEILQAPDFDVANYTPEARMQLYGDPNFDWSRVPAWHKYYYDLAVNNPVVFQAVAQGLGGLAGGPLSAGLQAGIGAITAAAAEQVGYDPYRQVGQQVRPADDAPLSDWARYAGAEGLAALNYMAEAAEQSIGFAAQAIVDPAAVIENPKAAWDAGRVTYESTTLRAPVMNLLQMSEAWVVLAEVAELAGRGEYEAAADRAAEGMRSIQFADIERNQDFILGRAAPVDTFGGMNSDEVLASVRQRIVDGANPDDILQEYQEETVGSSLADLVLQSVADPLNFAGQVEAGIAGKVADIANKPQLAGVLRQSDGLVSGLTAYRAAVQSGAVGPVNTLDGFDRWVGGLTRDGIIRDLQPNASPGALKNFFNLDGPSKAAMFIRNVKDFMGVMVDAGMRDPLRTVQTLRGWAGGDMQVAAEMGAAFLDSPQAYTILPAMRGMDEMLETKLAQWEVSAANRAILDKVSEALGQSPREIVDTFATPEGARQQFARLVDALRRSNDEAARGILADIEAGGMTPLSLAEVFKVFNDDPQLLDAERWHVDLLSSIEDHTYTWVEKAFKIGKEHPIFTLGRTLKAMQSIALLGFSPGYLMTNVINNEVTRAAWNAGGYISKAEGMRWLEKFGVSPSRLDTGAGPAEFAKQTPADQRLNDAVIGKGALATLYRAVSGFGQKVGIAAKLSGLAEGQQSFQATLSVMRRTWDKVWKRGAGFELLPPQAEARLRQVNPGLVDALYRTIEGSMSQKELSANVSRILAGNIDNRARVRDLVDTVADRAGMSADDAADLLNAAGITGPLEEALRRARSSDERNRAFMDAQDKAREFVTIKQANELAGMVEHTRNQIRAEGWPALRDIMERFTIERAAAWDNHHTAWENVFSKRDETDPALFNLLVKRRRLEASREFARINRYESAVYRGIVEALGVKDGGSRELLAGLTDLHNARRDFFERSRQLWEDLGRTEFQTSAEFWSAYNRVQNELDKLYANLIDTETTRQMSIDGRFAALLESIGVDMAGAEQYFAQSRELYTARQRKVQQHKAAVKAMRDRGVSRKKIDAFNAKFWKDTSKAQALEYATLRTQGARNIGTALDTMGRPMQRELTQQVEPVRSRQPDTPHSDGDRPMTNAEFTRLMQDYGGSDWLNVQRDYYRTRRQDSIPPEVVQRAIERRDEMRKMQATIDDEIKKAAQPEPQPEPVAEPAQPEPQAEAAPVEAAPVEAAPPAPLPEPVQLTPLEELKQYIERTEITKLPEDLREALQITLRTMAGDIVEGAPKSIHKRIVELGGIDKVHAQDVLPDNWLLFRRNKGNLGGYPLDTMARIMQDEGYLPKQLPPDDPDGVKMLTELIQQEAAGRPAYATFAGEGRPLPAWMKAITGKNKAARMQAAQKLLDQVLAGLEIESAATRRLKAEAFEKMVADYERFAESNREELERYTAGPDLPPDPLVVPLELRDRYPELAATLDEAGQIYDQRLEEYFSRLGEIEDQGKVLDAYDQAQETISDAQTEARELITAAEIESLLVEKFDYSPEQARMNTDILRARADAWARLTGQPADQWFRKIGGILGIDEALGGDGLAQNTAGATRFLDNGQALIKAFEARDATTFMHEAGHVLRRDLYATAEGLGIDAPKWLLDDQITLEKWAGATDGNWTREAEEKFARGWEQYLAEGRAPVSALQRVFDYFKRAMLDIYRQITGSAIDAGLTDEVRGVMDRLLGAEEPADTGTAGGLLPGMQQATGMLFDVQEGGRRTRMEAGQARSIYDVEPGRKANDADGKPIKTGDIISSQGQQYNVAGVNRAGRIVTADNKLLNPADVRKVAGQDTMFQQQAHGLFDPDRKDLPPGSYDYLAGYMPESGGWNELYTETISPLLEAMREEANSARETISAAGLDPATQADLQSWARKLNGQMSTAKYQTMKYAEEIRDRAMLDYSRRYGVDSVANLAYPYQFWYTRSVGNWALMALDRPALFAFYNRLQRFGEQYRRNQPERLRNKMRFALPYLPDWAGGGLYIDPDKDLFPFSQFSRPFDTMLRDETYQQNNAVYILQKWEESGSEETAAVMRAIQTRSGPLWERAMAEAGIEREAEVSGPLDFVNLMLGPAWYITTATNLIKGTPEAITPTPMYRTGAALQTALKGTAMEWAGNLIGGTLAAPERWLREQAGLSEFGQWGDYYIDRQLANMAADGEHSPEEVRLAMIERSGPIYDKAVERVQFEQMVKVPGMLPVYAAARGQAGAAAATLPVTMFSGQLLPDGELRFSGLKEAWNFAWEQDKALQERDPQAYEQNKRNGATNVQRFLEKYPEYETRLALRKEPEERLRQFLISEIWDRYMALDKQDRRTAANQLGDDFRSAFLDKETRSYESLDPETLALWSRALGGIVPETQATQAAADFDMPPLLRVPDAVKPAIDAYYQERDRNYPGIVSIQEGYYAVPEVNRKNYLNRFPVLRQYWDWRAAWLDTNPQAAPFVSQTSAEKVMTGETPYPYMPLDQLGDLLTVYYDEQQPAAGQVNYFAELSPITQRVMLEYAMTRKRPGLGALKELRRVWDEAGQPGTFDQFLEEVASGAN